MQIYMVTEHFLTDPGGLGMYDDIEYISGLCQRASNSSISGRPNSFISAEEPPSPRPTKKNFQNFETSATAPQQAVIDFHINILGFY